MTSVFMQGNYINNQTTYLFKIDKSNSTIRTHVMDDQTREG